MESIVENEQRVMRNLFSHEPISNLQAIVEENFPARP
jgi:hypothetical protein